MNIRPFLSIAVALLGLGFTARADNAQQQNLLAIARAQKTSAKAECQQCRLPEQRAQTAKNCPPCPICPESERKLMTKTAPAKKGKTCANMSVCPSC